MACINRKRRDRVGRTNEHRCPAWWPRAVTIEYLDCRDYGGPDEIWAFNFDRLRQDDVRRALEERKVVIHGTVFHNVHEVTWRTRAVGRLVSSVPIALSYAPEDAVPEGPVSPYNFPFVGNPISVWDPKLDLSRHFQVFEDGRLWQWKFADFTVVEGRDYGKWVSNEVDLDALDELHPRLAKLRNKPVRPGQPGHAEFVEEVRKLYAWLEASRAPIREKLWEVHLVKKKRFRGQSKVVAYAPPVLSQFEDFTVKDGELLTRFHAEPVFFRAMIKHCRRAKDLSIEPNSQLDEVYEERLQAVVNAAACVEAFVNVVALERVPQWERYEILQPEAKWHLCLLSHGKPDIFDAGREPYQTFGKVVELRNRWLHYKKPFERSRVASGTTITWLEARMSQSFVALLPVRVKQLIEELCGAIEYPLPSWLSSAPGWEV